MSLLTNLISFWKLDEASGDAIDAHGSNELTDTNTVTSSTGLVYSTARQFVAANSEYFTINDNASLSAGNIDFTIALWCKFDSLPGGASGWALLGKKNSTALEYDILYSDATDTFMFRVCSDTLNTNITAVNATNFGAASTGTWYFVVGWHDATADTINIQVNNSTPNSASYTHGSFDSTAPLRIGGYPDFSEYMNGLIGPAMLWKRLLTSDERTALYNSGAGLAYENFAGGGGAANPYYYFLNQ